MGNGQNTGCGIIFAILAGALIIVSIITSIVADINLLSMF